jgi:hypothetical protein
MYSLGTLFLAADVLRRDRAPVELSQEVVRREQRETARSFTPPAVEVRRPHETTL